MSATRIFGNGVSLGDPTSLITQPIKLTHANLEGTPAAVPADLIRVSCGLEDPRDLVADLDQAIRRANAALRD